jgi:hypothetical protein
VVVHLFVGKKLSPHDIDVEFSDVEVKVKLAGGRLIASNFL